MWKYDSPIGPIYIAMLNTGRYGVIFTGNVFGHNLPQMMYIVTLPDAMNGIHLTLHLTMSQTT